MNLSLIREYTREVLAFRMEDEHAPDMVRPAVPGETPKAAERCLRAFTRVPSPVMILFGAGTGQLIEELSATLPEEAFLIVCELSPTRARTVMNEFPDLFSNKKTVLLADSSPWAILHLLHLSGASPESACLMLNPELGESSNHEKLAALRRTVAAATPQSITKATDAHPLLSATAILHPEDSGLEAFFNQFPHWLQEIVIVWDADAVPDRHYSCACPIRQTARPLDTFAAQRNTMLAACHTDKIIYLDADEHLTQTGWECTKALATSEFEAVWFPRETLFPDPTRCKVGYGLWPDLQLRLFSRHNAHFVRPIHERIEGLNGPAALLLDLPIIHESRLRKDDQRIREKLNGFDAKAGANGHHHLNKDYPTFRRELLGHGAATALLRLNHNPG